MRFVHDNLPQRVRFGSGEAAVGLEREIGDLGASRVMVIASNGEAELADRITNGLPVALRHHDVVMHVPVEVAERAREAAKNAKVDAVVSVGGGSTTGLAKAIALTSGLPVIAVPTTYAGSEATAVWGLTEGARKATGTDPRVLPKAIVYDAALTTSLPVEMSVASGLNALAHCVDAMWGPNADPINAAFAAEGIRSLRTGLPKVVARPGDIDGREHALYAAYLSAAAFASAGSGLHHKICHVLGGAYNLPHAQTHAVVLPYVLAFNAPRAAEAERRIAAAFGTERAIDGLRALRAELGAPRALRDYGFAEADIPAAAEAILPAVPPSNPRPVTAEDLRRLLHAAWAGASPELSGWRELRRKCFPSVITEVYPHTQSNFDTGATVRSKGIVFSSVLIVTLGLIALLGGSSRAASASPVTLTGYQQMAVDDVGGNSYIFLSRGSENGIAVTDLSGNAITTLDSGDLVEGLALSADGSTLYAAVASGTDADKVAVITVSSITSTTTTPNQTFDALGAGEIPYSLAIQTGKLWVSYASNGGAEAGAIGDIDLTSGTFESDSVGGTWYSAPDLAGDPQDGGTLVAVQPGIEPAMADTYSTTNGTLAALVPQAFLGNSSAECDYEHQIAVVPGGQQFIAACGSPQNEYVYSTNNLGTGQSHYVTGTSYPGGVAINPADGTVAVGTYGSPSQIYVYKADGTLLNILTVADPAELVSTNGLAWENTANGPALVAVTQSSGSSGFSVEVFGQPTLAQSALTLSGPSTALIGKPVTLTGSLTLSNGAPLPANTQVTITRTGPGSTTATTLPPVQPGSNGSFTVTDTPPAATGTYAYTASYGGDPSVATAATATARVTVNLNTATLSLSGPSSVSIGKSVTLSGSLALGNGVTLPSGTKVTVTRTGPGSTGSKAFTVTPTSSGSFTLTDTPSATGAYGYKAQYAGNATTVAATASHAVTVNPLATSLSVTTGATTFNYRTTIHVVAHLGTTYTNRTVSIYEQWDGYQSRTLLKTGRVNSHGELTVSYTAPHSTNFTAVFTGDAHYGARTVSHNVGVWASVGESIGNYYTSTHYGSTLYRVYHHTANLRESVTVSPNKSGECVKVEVQIYYQGKWYANLLTGCGSLNSSSKISGLFNLSQATGYRYRIRADYVRSSKDTSNLSNDSGWLYFVVVK